MHPVALLIAIAVLAVTIVLIFVQRRLSRKKNPIIGLIIPVVYLLLSSVIGLILTGGAPFWQYLRWFLISNIPTVVYLLIYFFVRYKLKQNNDLDKMKAAVPSQHRAALLFRSCADTSGQKSRRVTDTRVNLYFQSFQGLDIL